MKTIGISGGIGALLGVVLIFVVEPGTIEGATLLMLVSVLVCGILGAICSGVCKAIRERRGQPQKK